MSLNKIKILSMFICLFLSFALNLKSQEKVIVHRIYSDNYACYCEIIHNKLEDISISRIWNQFSESLDGQMKIYFESNDSLIHNFNFAPDIYNIFISNNGENILYLNDYKNQVTHYTKGKIDTVCYLEDYFEDNSNNWKPYENNNLQIPFDTIKKYGFDSNKYRVIVEKFDTTYSKYYYDNNADDRLIFASRHNLLSINDTVYLITKNLALICIPIRTGEIIIKDYLSNFEYLRDNYKPIRKEQEAFEFDINNIIFKNSKTLIEKLNKNTEFDFYTIEEYSNNFQNFDSLLNYAIYFVIEMNKNGKYEINSAMASDINICDTIVKIVKEIKLQDFSLPPKVERWVDRKGYNFIRKNKLIAKEEFIKSQLIVENQLKADSINGIYIPNDINDCISQLENLLPDSTKLKIDKCTKEKKMIRNIDSSFITIFDSWGYSGISRLGTYFFNMNIFAHWDKLIILVYYRYRHKQEFNFEELVKEYQQQIRY